LPDKIDVVMCTYNSNTPYFNAVLRAISREIPVHCFIAVDRLSSDGTVSRILEVFPEAKIVQSQENLGRARKIGINKVDTSFFMFVDSDVLLLKGWYEYVKGLMKNGTGAVASFAQDEGELNRGLAYNQTLPCLVFSSKNNVDSQRGWTYATLIRKEAVTNWEPNRMLSAGEDHELLRHVVTQGFLWVTSYFVFAKHLEPVQSYFAFYQNLWKKYKWNAAGLRYIKFTKSTFSRQLFKSLQTFWAGIKMAFLFRNAFLIPHYFVYCLASNYGYVNWRKELFLHR
jgi:glycosyltransferase involved in cell wall biosynthesis